MLRITHVRTPKLVLEVTAASLQSAEGMDSPRSAVEAVSPPLTAALPHWEARQRQKTSQSLTDKTPPTMHVLMLKPALATVLASQLSAVGRVSQLLAARLQVILQL